MKLAAAFSILFDLRAGVLFAFKPTVRAIIETPSLLFKPATLSRLFFANVWITFGDGVDGNCRSVKEHLITPNAYGIVLDLGAGHGHTVNYLDPHLVAKYVALEPNTHMHAKIRSVANAAGFTEEDGTLLILSCGAEDAETIVSAVGNGISTPRVDTLISIMTLCTVPSPKSTISSLVSDVLKPGGQILFYEHVLSHRSDVAWWQRFWTPIWTLAFDGCKLDRPTHLWLQQQSTDDGRSVWGETELWGKEGEDEEDLFWHQVGKFVKRV